MSVVPYEPRVSRSWVELMTPAVELAKAVAGTEFVPKALRNNPAAITAAILFGDEVGLGPMQALAKIAVIDGRPTLAAEAQRALILAAGHSIWIEEATVTKVTVAGRRRDADETSRFTWTLDDARRAGLVGRPAWKAYPRQMLLARASAELARAIFADAIGGLAATEEIEELAAAGSENGPEPTPGTQKRKRKRTNVAATVASEPPPLTEGGLPPLPGEEAPAPEPAPPPEDESSEIADEGPIDEWEHLEDEVAAGEEPLLESDADSEGPPMITDKQRPKMHALFREKGIETREARLAYAEHIAQREVKSSLDLTMEEASRVIDALEAWDPKDPSSRPFPDALW